jgi:hypothetical protein
MWIYNPSRRFHVEAPPMKAYLLTTGTLFGILAAIHVFVVVAQLRVRGSDPWPAVVLEISAGFNVWAWRLMRVPGAR